MRTPSRWPIALALVAALVTTTDAQPRRGWYYLFASAAEDPVLVGPLRNLTECLADQLTRSHSASRRFDTSLRTLNRELKLTAAGDAEYAVIFKTIELARALEAAGIKAARWTTCEEAGR
jgi:hypothetical protein